MRKRSKPSSSPQNITEGSWYYEYPTRIEYVFHEAYSDEIFVGLNIIRVPWRKLKALLRRCQP